MSKHSTVNVEFLFISVVNGHSTCCQFSSVESPITTIFFLHALRLARSLLPNSKILVPSVYSQSLLNFFLFPVVNGQSTCYQFSSVESPITTIFLPSMPSVFPPRCPLTQNPGASHANMPTLPVVCIFWTINDGDDTLSSAPSPVQNFWICH